MRKLTRRKFIQIVGAASTVMAAGLLAGCGDADGGNVSGGVSGGNGSSDTADEKEAPSDSVDAPSSSTDTESAESYTVTGTVVRGENYKTEIKTTVRFCVGKTEIEVEDERKIIYMGTTTIKSIATYTLSAPLQKVKRLGQNLGDSAIFYVPEYTTVRMKYREHDEYNEFESRDFQWIKTASLKTNKELTVLGDAGKISSGEQVTITSGGMYQFCWANEEDSYAVAGNIVFNVS